eukprot:3731937-Alexandrium_andersonii.AAC.1
MLYGTLPQGTSESDHRQQASAQPTGETGPPTGAKRPRLAGPEPQDGGVLGPLRARAPSSAGGK